MQETLKRDLNKTYLIVSSGEKQYEESYEMEMILQNNPETILPLHILRVNGEMQLFYDVSSKQTLKDCAARAKLSGETIRLLFETIEKLIEEMQDYLLDMESIVLDLDHIYTKEGNFYFCYCPWEKQDVLRSFRMMLEEILGNLDYYDTEAVELAYHLYQSACRGNFHISEILEEHSKKEIKPVECIEENFYEEKCVREEFSDSKIKDGKKEQQDKKPGIAGRILKFFMKKEKPKTEKEEQMHQEPYESVYYDEPSTSCIELEASADANTTLMENMPMGRWKLRPLVPGYEEFCITEESFLVGKKKEAVDGYIGRDTISRIHSRLFVRHDRLFIADANSTNGTFVNGAAINPGTDVEIFAGDRILFADVGYECYNSL